MRAILNAAPRLGHCFLVGHRARQLGPLDTQARPCAQWTKRPPFFKGQENFLPLPVPIDPTSDRSNFQQIRPRRPNTPSARPLRPILQLLRDIPVLAQSRCGEFKRTDAEPITSRHDPS